MSAEIVSLADRARRAETAAWRAPAAPSRHPVRMPVLAPALPSGCARLLPLDAEPIRMPTGMPRGGTRRSAKPANPFPLLADVVLGLTLFLLLAALAGVLVLLFALLWRVTQP